MADSIETLKELALLIRNATKTGENTAERVGRTLVGIIENLSSIDIEELAKIFLRKDQPDETQYLIKFFAGLEAGLYAEGGKDGSKLHDDGLAELGRMQVNGDSEFRGNLSSQEFISGFLTGRGWAIQMKKIINAAGVEETKAVGELDDLIVRGTLRVFEFVVSQLLGENDNRIFTAMLEVDHYDAATGKVYLDTQQGKFYNPFRKDDYIMVQQYNGMPSAENSHYVTKQYELIVTAIGMEGDLAWVTFKNFTTPLEGGTPESLITRKDTFVRVDNLSDPDRKGIIQMMTVGSNTPYMNVAYGLKTDPDNALKVRIGKLEGIYNSLFGWLKSYGAYLINLYAVGEYRQRSTGDDLYLRIEMLKEQFLTEYKKQYYDLTDEDNFLKNTAFTDNMQYWSIVDGARFLTVNGDPLYVNRSMVVMKTGHAGVEEYNGKNMLRLNNITIKQLNADIRKPGTHKEYVEDSEGLGEYKNVKDKLYLSIRIIARTSGTLRIGFPTSGKDETSLPYAEVEIQSSNDIQTLQWSGTWDGTGDFQLGYTGDMYVSLLSLTTDPLANYMIETSTQFKQTSSVIGMYGQRIDNINQTVTSLGVQIDAANEQISIYANKVNNLESTVTNLGIEIDAVDERVSIYADKLDDLEYTVTRLGLDIDAVDERVTLYANKTTENEQQIAQLEVRVDGISSTVIAELNGNTIVSKINQSATTVSIDAQKINLNGAVTANNYFKINTDGSMEAIAGSIGGIKIERGYIGTNYNNSGLFINNEMVAIRYSKTIARIGYDVGNIFTAGNMAGYFSCEETPSVSGVVSTNVGLNIYVKGANAYDNVAYSGNHALYIIKGDICGFRLRTRRVNASMTLDKMDSNIIVVKKDITLTLPTYDVEDGQMYFIRNHTDGNVKVSGSISALDNPGSTSSSVDLTAGYLMIIIYDKVNNKWMANRCDNW